MEVLLEIETLRKTIEKSNKSLKFRLDSDEDFDKDTSYLDEEVTYGKALFSVLKGISKNDLLLINDSDLLVHIRKVQLLEKEV